MTTEVNLEEAIRDFYLGRKAYSSAKKYLTVALPMFEKYQITNRLEDTHWAVAKADSGLDDYQSAFEHFRAYDKFKDSVFEVDRNRQIEEINLN